MQATAAMDADVDYTGRTRMVKREESHSTGHYKSGLVVFRHRHNLVVYYVDGANDDDNDNNIWK